MGPMILNGDCLERMRGMGRDSVDAIVTDPPYYKVKGEAWDNQWDNPAAFLAWIDQLSEQWERILRPNGSLYVFASPKMAARVEVKIGERFNVLNQIVWSKADTPTHALKYGDERFRLYVQKSERIIFAEHYGADNMAKGESGYVAKCDELRGFIFEPLRAYLAGEWERAGLQPREGNTATNSFMAGHYFTQSQWALPTAAMYGRLRAYANRSGGEYLKREYEDLNREYEDLKREYEDLRRPFSVSADVPYTDVWDFRTVSHYPGKHPCEKPVELMAHIVRSSTKPGAIVLDCFMGTGATGVACKQLGRDFIGIELDQGYCETAERRIETCQLEMI